MRQSKYFGLNMQHEPLLHKIADALQHAWPVIAGFISFSLIGFKVWWLDRRNTKNRIKNLEILAEQTVYKSDLQACRDDVREVDDKNLEKISEEIKELSRRNAEEHTDIMKQMIKLHSGN